MQTQTSVGEDVEKRESSCTVGGNADLYSLCGKHYGVPSVIKNRAALWHSDSTYGNISEETLNTDLKEHMHPYAHCSIIYNSQDSGAAQVPISSWVGKKPVVYLHNGILLVRKKGGNVTFCNSIDGSEEYYAKWNKPVRERKYYMILVTWGI